MKERERYIYIHICSIKESCRYIESLNLNDNNSGLMNFLCRMVGKFNFHSGLHKFMFNVLIP